MQVKRALPRALLLSLLCICGLKPTAVQAQVHTRSVRTSEDTTRPSGFGLNLFVAGDGAFIRTNPSDAEESAKQGTLFGGKALLSFVNRDLEIEGGAGYNVSLLRGTGDIVDGETLGSKVRLENVKVETRTAVTEFSARLKLNDNVEGDGIWSIGPTAAAFLGTNASFGTDTAKQYNSSIFLGGTLALEFGTDVKPRLALTYLSDVNLFERQVHIGLLSLQFGYSLFKPKTVVKDIRNQTNDETVRNIPVERKIERTIVKEQVRFLLDSEMVNFETDKAVLLKRSEFFLKELGLVLAQNPERWTSVIIEGHTDIRGTLEHNNRLSLARASSVREALLRSGVQANRMKAVGYGPTRPIDPAQNEVAWARNRRVELSFEGNTDSRWLRDIMQKLKAALNSSRH